MYKDNKRGDKTRGTAGSLPVRSGAVDWIAAGLAGLLLVSATACASPGTAPAAAPAAVESSAPAMEGAPLDPETTPDAGEGSSAPHQQPAFASKALEVLATIPVKGRAPKTGYSRDQFGQAWADVDRNGCDTRIICTLASGDVLESL